MMHNIPPPPEDFWPSRTVPLPTDYRLERPTEGGVIGTEIGSGMSPEKAPSPTTNRQTAMNELLHNEIARSNFTYPDKQKLLLLIMDRNASSRWMDLSGVGH